MRRSSGQGLRNIPRAAPMGVRTLYYDTRYSPSHYKLVQAESNRYFPLDHGFEYACIDFLQWKLPRPCSNKTLMAANWAHWSKIFEINLLGLTSRLNCLLSKWAKRRIWFWNPTTFDHAMTKRCSLGVWTRFSYEVRTINMILIRSEVKSQIWRRQFAKAFWLPTVEWISKHTRVCGDLSDATNSF